MPVQVSEYKPFDKLEPLGIFPDRDFAAKWVSEQVTLDLINGRESSRYRLDDVKMNIAEFYKKYGTHGGLKIIHHLLDSDNRSQIEIANDRKQANELATDLVFMLQEYLNSTK